MGKCEGVRLAAPAFGPRSVEGEMGDGCDRHDGSDASEATYATMIHPGEEILVGA